MEVIILGAASGIAGALTFAHSLYTKYKSNKANKKTAENIERMCYALGIVEEENEMKERDPTYESNLQTPNEPLESPSENSEISSASNISIRGVKYCKKTQEIILPPGYETDHKI